MPTHREGYTVYSEDEFRSMQRGATPVAVKSHTLTEDGRTEKRGGGEPQKRRRPDPIAAIGYIGLLLGLLAVGGALWAINGGYSVLGLEVIARAFNSSGAAFWGWISGWTFTLPSAIPGLSTTQPVIPWIGVIAASLLQVSVLLLGLLGRTVPPVLAVAATLFSVYDYGTTVYGLGTVPWLAGPGLVAQLPIAFILAFLVEGCAALLIRHLMSLFRR